MNPSEGKDKSNTKPVYAISIAAELTNLPVHTIRWLETNELIEPGRTDGNQRLYSDAHIELLKEIALLLDKKINIAGIREIIAIRKTYLVQAEPTDKGELNSEGL